MALWHLLQQLLLAVLTEGDKGIGAKMMLFKKGKFFVQHTVLNFDRGQIEEYLLNFEVSNKRGG